ncbi:IS3 family transposase [Bifidobacterium cuniculi]|uniref:Putative transposase InsK n=7 Tax=Bifidobacterium cuniculi TaxID=1688 RepID=A0A087B2L1_9BIFI|nr:IS3 family transposase [Bifidobacterium cuniculi]KFI65261.1 putative transposase InsK [Bifidobacterium cuniculi]
MSNRDKVAVCEALSGRFPLGLLLECLSLSRSSRHYVLTHEAHVSRPDLHGQVREIFHGPGPNGCGHRQVWMQLRERGERVTRKTVLKIMGVLGLRCTIRRARHGRYDSYRGDLGGVCPDLVRRDFHAAAPFVKLGTDVTEFKQPWGKAYLAPVVDWCTKRIVAYSISRHPDWAQQADLLAGLADALPAGAVPLLHSDQGWQYQQPAWARACARMGIVRSMSRKGNCLDNAATEQVFGHLKDEFFRGRQWADYESFKRDLEGYIRYWNSTRCQAAVGGMSPDRYEQALLALAG